MQPWKTLKKKTILEHSKYLVVESHTVELPDGTIILDWPWVITPDYVIVIPVSAEGIVTCFRQVKYSVPGTTLAPVGGYLEPGEDPLAAAKRELKEEMGLASEDWTRLGQYQIDGNRGVAACYLYLARNTIWSADRDADDLEEQEIVTLNLEEVRAALKVGEFKVLAWAAAVSLALLDLEEKER
ncbi:MAG TPA: NUDIX hydrolase [Anaerolineaceae bacterium]|nr:NUDIX hydrolase [Anaerolineaceae bacterium]